MKLTDMKSDELVFVEQNGSVHGVERVSYAINMVRECKDIEIFTAVKTEMGPVTEYDVKEALLNMDHLYQHLHPDDDISLGTASCCRIAYNINSELLEHNTFYGPGEKIDIDSVFVKDFELNNKRRELGRLYNRLSVSGGFSEEVIDALLKILEPLDK